MQKPIFGELWHVDALDYLSSLPDDSVDMVLADPPYFIGFDGGKGWDRQWSSEDDYLAWCKDWTAEAVRVLAHNRMLIVWGTLKTDTFLKYKLEVLNSFTQMKSQNEIIWSYNWGGRGSSNFARKHEYAWCYSKGDRFLFHADDVRVERKVSHNIRTGERHTKGTIPTSVWQVNNHTGAKDACNWHPTTKNLTVLSRMIKAYTDKGDVVCDPFFGSGSTAVASLREGRSFVGSEKDSEYFERAVQRLAHLL